MYLQLYAELYYCTMMIGWLVFHLGSFITPLLGWTYNVFRPSYDPSDLTYQGASIIVGFTTPGESHFVWPSLVLLQTPQTPWTIFVPLMFPISSLKTCKICYTRLFNPFSRIYACLTPKNAYIGMCAKGQILLEFSLMWIRLTCLLAFHMPLDHSDSTFHYPIEELYN